MSSVSSPPMLPIIIIWGGIGGALPARAQGLARNCGDATTSTRLLSLDSAEVGTAALSLPANALLILPSSEIAIACWAKSPWGLSSVLVGFSSTLSVATEVELGEVRATTLRVAPGCLSGWGTSVDGKGKTSSS